jgi:hypothetical protein
VEFSGKNINFKLKRCNKEMTLIKILDKYSKLRLEFEHPIVLNPEKKFKLGVTNLLFSFNKIFKIKYFVFECYISPNNVSYFTLKTSVS